MNVLFLLLCAHALADYPLQGDFIAKFKARKVEKQIWSMGEKETVMMPNPMWVHCLTAHAFIHGGFVYIITGSLTLGVCEILAHWIIDFGKCEGWYGINTDQLMHIGCKILWCVMLLAFFL